MRTLPMLLLAALLLSTPPAHGQSLTLSRGELLDKIKGGWAAQTIGVTFGGPTEFRFNGTFIQDYFPIPWYDGLLRQTYEQSPGLYDDLYMDLTFVDVLEREGLDAPPQSFADAFAQAGYALWHANQQARYNILNGVAPPASGHWLNNPHADDIDFQIEADFAGLMAPAMPGSAAAICDRVGHTMNSGDGYYGGVFVAGLYALAFTTDDVGEVVDGALRLIPEASTFHQTIRDVVAWHRQYPDDWKRTWMEIQRKWAQDVGCPDGVFDTFDIDAKLNAAYVVLGLLYGDGDFGKTLSVATRAGQDSDCNPASAAGVLGTMKGYDAIPAFWKQGLAEVEPMDFKYTTISLDDAYRLSLKHALEMIARGGGRVTDDSVTIRVQRPEPVPLEQNFEGHHPVERRPLGLRLDGSTPEATFRFTGIGFALQGAAEARGAADVVLRAELYVDGRRVEVAALPTAFATRRYSPFWRYQLPPGEHEVRIRLLDAAGEAALRLDQVVVYDAQPRTPAY